MLTESGDRLRRHHQRFRLGDRRRRRRPSDGIFSDGYSLQLATVTGSVEEGYVATLNVPI